MTQPRSFADWAKLTPDESVARWRIASAVWAGRLLAVIWLVSTLLTNFMNRQGNWLPAVLTLVICAAVYFAAQRVQRGSRAAAIFLLALFILDRVVTWSIGRARWYEGGLLFLVILFCFAQGVWGTFVLAREQRRRQDAGKITPTVAA